MVLTETIFVSSKPVGVVRQDTNTKQADFSPIDGTLMIQDRNWSSVDELRAVVQKVYSQKSKGSPK